MDVDADGSAGDAGAHVNADAHIEVDANVGTDIHTDARTKIIIENTQILVQK